MTRLVVLSGLPGVGKTTLARGIVPELHAAYLRVDVVETPLVAAGVEVGGLGYEIVRDLAASNLACGQSAVVDLVNPLPVTRRMWVDLAIAAGVELTVLECVLPDRAEHRRRVESRVADIPGHTLPTWADVAAREYTPWDEARDGARVVIDTTDAATALAIAREALPLS